MRDVKSAHWPSWSMVDNRGQTAFTKTNPFQTPNDWFHHCPTMQKSIVGTNDRGSNSSQPVNPGLFYQCWTLAEHWFSASRTSIWTLPEHLQKSCITKMQTASTPKKKILQCWTLKKSRFWTCYLGPRLQVTSTLSATPKSHPPPPRFPGQEYENTQFCRIPLFWDDFM